MAYFGQYLLIFLTASLATTSYHIMTYIVRTHIVCIERIVRTPVSCHPSTAYWTLKLYVNYVRFTVLSFLVFHPLFLHNNSVYR